VGHSRRSMAYRFPVVRINATTTRSRWRTSSQRDARRCVADLHALAAPVPSPRATSLLTQVARAWAHYKIKVA
jgi:hypothetical protein